MKKLHVYNVKGSRTSRCAKGTIIGPNTGVYVGGLPADFEIRRTNRDQRLKVSVKYFISTESFINVS
jgi:hypothetical protein